MKTIDRLHYLTVLAEEQNITKAAARLYVSQPALTAYINRIEAELDVKLFDRSKTPIRLTEAGAFYLAEMHHLESERTRIENTMRGLGNMSSRSLSICIGRNRSAIWLPEIVPKLYRRYPDLHLVVDEGRDLEMVESVRRGTCDIAIVETYAYIGSLHHQVIGDEINTLVTGKKHQLFQAYASEPNDPLHPLDIKSSVINQARFFCPSVKGALSDAVKRLFDDFQVNPSEIIFIGNNSTNYRLAMMGLGVTYLCTSHANFIRTEDDPLFIMPGGEPDRRKLYAVSKRAEISSAAEYFV